MCSGISKTCRRRCIRAARCSATAARWTARLTGLARLATELRRYDAVIFFETAAVGGASIEGGNPVRNESLAEAVELDGRLRKLWARHPRFVLIPNNRSFFKKIGLGLAALADIVAQIGCDPRCAPPEVLRKRGEKGGD